MVTILFINYEWRRLISDALQSYADSIIRYLDDSLIDDFRNKFQALLNDLYTAEIMDNTPVGAVMWFPLDVADLPDKWLVCDGSAVSAAAYPELYNKLRFNFGSGGGTFNLPNLTAQFLYGAGNDGHIGNVGGDAVHTLTIAEIPSHSHVQNTKGAPAGAVLTTAGFLSSAATPVTASTTSTATTGGGGSHNNMPPYMRGYWCIKALP